MYPRADAAEVWGHLGFKGRPWGTKALGHMEAASPILLHAIHQDAIQIKSNKGWPRH